MNPRYNLKIRYFAYAVPIILLAVFVAAKGYHLVVSNNNGATVISTSVQSDGNFVLNDSASKILFNNGWKISQTSGATTQLSITDSNDSAVLIFDEN